MTEFRGSERSDLNAGEAGDRRSDVPMHMAMEVAIPATPAGVIIFEPMERNEDGIQRGRSEAQAAHSDWRSPMARTR